MSLVLCLMHSLGTPSSSENENEIEPIAASTSAIGAVAVAGAPIAAAEPGGSPPARAMITRSKLVEQLRDHQVRSRRRCPGLALFSPKPHIATRADVAVAIFWAVVFSMLVGLTYLAFRHGHFWLSFLTACLGSCLLVCFWKSRHALAREKEKRLPLSL